MSFTPAPKKHFSGQACYIYTHYFAPNVYFWGAGYIYNLHFRLATTAEWQAVGIYRSF